MNLYPTPADLDSWIASSHKGDRFVYHTGHLLHDRAFRVTLAATGGYATIRVIPLEQIALAAVAAYEAGYVVLAQKKVSQDVYQYLAIRTKKYRKPPLAAKPKELVNA
jgi:hypothetical protein